MPMLVVVFGSAARYVCKHLAERHDSFGKSCPIRGTHIPSQ